MSTAPAADVTRLLLAWGHGDGEALERLTPLVYGEPRALAHARMRAERPGGQTLQTTALVHEAFVRLVDGARVDWHDPSLLCGVCPPDAPHPDRQCARSPRQARRRRPVDPFGGPARRRPGSDEDLSRSTRRCSAWTGSTRGRGRSSNCGTRRLDVEETAEVLGTSVETVKRDWRTARTWLRRDLRLQDGSLDEGRP